MLKGLGYRFKYIVPFMHYAESSGTSSYEAINNALNQSEEWEPSSAKTRQEQDIYNYVLDSMEGAKYCSPTNGEKDKCICSVWKNSAVRKDHCKYIYYADKKENKRTVINFRIFNVEMFLFRNHVGMICYEIGFLNKDELSKLSLEDVCGFQNCFIEFGRKKSKWIMLDQLFEDEYDKRALSICPPSGQKRKEVLRDWKKLIKLINEETSEEKYIAPDDLGRNGVYDKINGKAYYAYEEEVPGKSDKIRLKVYRKLNLGRWINYTLSCINKDQNIRTEYCSSKTVYPEAVIPDKAIVYSCTMIGDEDEADMKMVREVSYRLANGYPFGHNASTDVAEFWEHSTGVIWYASRQGCGCTVRKGSPYSSGFESVLNSTENDDYFLIFLLQLNQLFGLTYYDKAITKELTPDIREYLKENRPLQNELLQTRAEINLFLMKSSYAGISNIQKQNEFYSYVKKQLKLDENTASIQSGLDGLNALQESLAQKNREKTEERLNISLGILALLAVISALSEAKVLFWDSDPGRALNNLSQHPLFVVSSIVIVIMAIIAFINIIRCIVEARGERNK